MAEIKSTLDLVMEKTKDLSLSDEERQGQKNKEIGSRIRGLLNKFQDKAISWDRFNSEYRVLKKEYSLTGTGNEHLIKEICDQIELAKDNQALFDLLAELKVPDFEFTRHGCPETPQDLKRAACQNPFYLRFGSGAQFGK
jgi:hypothetical protein